METCPDCGDDFPVTQLVLGVCEGCAIKRDARTNEENLELFAAALHAEVDRVLTETVPSDQAPARADGFKAFTAAGTGINDGVFLRPALEEGEEAHQHEVTVLAMVKERGDSCLLSWGMGGANFDVEIDPADSRGVRGLGLLLMAAANAMEGNDARDH